MKKNNLTNSEAVSHRCASKDVFCKYAANIQEDTHAEV